MSENLEVNQNAAFGSHHNTFAGTVNNYGVPAENVAGMVIEQTFKLFHQYFPLLQKEALEEVHRMLQEKLKNIPPEDIVQPSPRIAIPSLQNASITEESEVRELYASLLANSMNKVVKDGVHPAFVEIIKQISPDEAKILRYMSIFSSVPTISLRAENKDQSGITVINCFSNIGELMKCEKPYDIGKYFDNLERLGVIRRSGAFESFTDKSIYEPLKSHEFIKEKEHSIQNSLDRNIPNILEGFVEITSFGRAFCDTCVTVELNITIAT